MGGRGGMSAITIHFLLPNLPLLADTKLGLANTHRVFLIVSCILSHQKINTMVEDKDVLTSVSSKNLDSKFFSDWKTY